MLDNCEHGRAISLVANALTAIDAGDVDAARTRHADAEDVDPHVTALAGAALALRDGDRATAAMLLDVGAGYHIHIPVIPSR